MRYLFIFISVFLFFGCFGKPNFMGADKYTTGAFMTSRWFLNPEYNKGDIPKGTEFYGVSADKIKDKFIIKYYEKTPDGKDDIEIPKKDIWTVKHNGRRYNYQDDNNLFVYEKQGNNYIKHIDHFGHKHTVEDTKYPLKECYSDGWCKLYPNYWKINLYIKQSILDKPLGE